MSAPDTFVRVSPRDPRYFELSDGTPYVPVGRNLVGVPVGDATGMLQRWMAQLAAHGGNYGRVWLTDPNLDVERAGSGTFDLVAADRLAALLDTAGRLDLRVMFCLE